MEDMPELLKQLNEAARPQKSYPASENRKITALQADFIALYQAIAQTNPEVIKLFHEMRAL